MNVTATNHDEVSALLTVTLEKSDYKEKVEKQLINYAKNAQVPGFRKGKVPLSMVRKQYEAGIAYEEINKQISEALNNYVAENKLRLVGQPVPQPVNDFNVFINFLSENRENYADMLSKYVFIVNRPKTENETVYYNVDYIHRVPVSVSTQFFGWLTGIGSGMRIVGPEEVRQQYKEYLQDVIQNY